MVGSGIGTGVFAVPAGITQPAVAVLGQTVVDGADPAFANPTKFIGPLYDQSHADALARRRGWTVAPDGAG